MMAYYLSYFTQFLKLSDLYIRYYSYVYPNYSFLSPSTAPSLWTVFTTITLLFSCMFCFLLTQLIKLGLDFLFEYRFKDLC